LQEELSNEQAPRKILHTKVMTALYWNMKINDKKIHSNGRTGTSNLSGRDSE
jgi:hypothetical protein